MNSQPGPHNGPHNTDELELRLSEPSPGLVADLARLEGDLLILGAGGKMGPSLAHLARRALNESRPSARVIAVARFTNRALVEQLNGWGIETLTADLLDDAALRSLPDAVNVMFMAGMKFGSTGNEPLTWAMNVDLPARVCRRYPDSRIAAFSTWNIYGLSPAVGGGSRESDSPRPVGDYAMSCLGRERMFEYFSQTMGIPTVILRLNYANEPRYGVLVDLARRVMNDEPVDLRMGCFNAIWQGDANAFALRAFSLCRSPATFLNIAGPETLGVRAVAEEFGAIFGRTPTFLGAESPDALLNDASQAFDRFGYPQVAAKTLMRWIADWLLSNQTTHNKPTHFEVRDGKF